jgi:UDP-glucose 4-epimerase
MRPAIDHSTVLVTGGAGFIGSHLVDRVLSEGARTVIIIDNMFLGSEENLRDAVSRGAILYKDDAEIFTSLEYIFARHSIDIVFNCATKALNYSFINPRNAFDTNVTVVLNLLELQRRSAFKTLCHFSTSEVYGSAVYEPMDEKHPRNPTTAYAAGKAAADMAVESYVKMFDLDAFIVRPFNNYGPRQNYQGYLAGVIPVTAWRILSATPPEIHGTGRQSRDFIYVYDTVDAVIKVFPHLAPGDNVNVSTDGQIAITDLVHHICRIMGYSGQVTHANPRPSDVLCHNASNRKLRDMIDFRLTPFTQGLQDTIAWYENLFRNRTR